MSEVALRQRAEDHPIQCEIFIYSFPKARTRTGRSANYQRRKNQLALIYDKREGKEGLGGPRVSGSE
jgi:hypothetical protein